MMSKYILTGATLALTGVLATAQSTTKPSAYEGVSQPPASDVIRATDSPAVAPVAPPTLPQPAAAPAQPATPKAAPAVNPDYGIVETPVANDAGAPAQDPSLHGRAYNPDADIVTHVPTPANALAEGAPIHTRLDRRLSSEDNGAGTRFTAQVVQDVVQNSRVIVPTGSTVHGRVIHADYGRRISGHASMRLRADEIVLPDGTRYSMSAVPSMTARSTGTRVNAEGEILTRDNVKALAAQYGIGAGAGAASGAVFGGPTGAIVGTGIGVGVITTHFLVNRQVAVLPAGTALTFGLTRPMPLVPIATTASR